MYRYLPLLLFIVGLSQKGGAQDSGFPFTEMDLRNLNDFKEVDNWKVAGDVFYSYKEGIKTSVTPGTSVLVNDPSGKTKDHLFSKMEHGDIELELDFMMDRNSNSGIYLQGRYEVQLFDSWGPHPLRPVDCGAIYERWDENRPDGRKGYEGHPPAQNVSKAPGLWQHFRIVFRAPRFNAKGEKTENARFISVVHNGVVIHANVDVSGPTRAAAFQDEKALGPLMIQGDHGPVALRNIRYKAYGSETITLSGLKLVPFEGRFRSVDDFKSLAPAKVMDIELLEHQGTETKDFFAGRITGTLQLPKSGKYFLQLNLKWIPPDTNPNNPNGGGVLQIGDSEILVLGGKKGGIVSAMVDLKAGQYPFLLSYYKTYRLWYAQSDDIVLSVEAPGIHFTNLNAALRSAEVVGAITVPVANEPVMQRSFINHGGIKKTHVLSVGEPGDINYTFDLRTGGFLQFWRGDFIETTLMWHERGEPQRAEPLGSVIALRGDPSLAFLTDKGAPWPDSTTGYNYLGYDINAQARPVFKYTIENAQVRTFFEAGDGGKKLSQMIAVSGATKPVWCKVAEGSDIVKQPNGLYAIDNKQYYVELSGKEEPILRRNARNSIELLVQVALKNNSGSVQYAIIW